MAAERLLCRDLWVGYRIKTPRGLPRFRQRSWALRGVNFSIAGGEIVGLVGGNGSGKTTLLRTIAGVYKPSRGAVALEGKVGALVELRPDADRDLSVRERVALSGVLLGFRRADRAYLEGLLTEFGDLDPAVLDAPLYTLSCGMLLRLEMSLLLHASWDLLAVDELLVTADAEFRQRCLQRIATICASGGAAIISSHDPSLVSDCDRLLHLEHGALVGPSMGPRMPARAGLGREVSGPREPLGPGSIEARGRAADGPLPSPNPGPTEQVGRGHQGGTIPTEVPAEAEIDRPAGRG
jgi:lipopolysaccharide transport system ATP-binding protein